MVNMYYTFIPNSFYLQNIYIRWTTLFNIIISSCMIVKYFFCKYLFILCKFCVMVRHHLIIASDYSNMLEKRCLCGYLTRMKSLSSKNIINFGNLYSLCNLIRLFSMPTSRDISAVHIKDAITLICVSQNNIVHSRQTSILI